MLRIVFFIGLTLGLSYGTPPEKCGFAEAVLAYQQGTRFTRPETETSALSPSGHFQVHFDLSGPDAPDQTDSDLNGVPDYIDEVGVIADSARQVLLEVMGYDPEPADSDGIYDIFVANRGPGAYGLTTLEGANGSSYLEIDNDFSEGYYIPGINTMRLTVAHEFFHAVQLGYETTIAFNRFFFEMSSTWIEDVIVPDGDDYLYWVNDYFADPDQNIDDTDGYSIALFGHYLVRMIENVTDETGSTIMRRIWEDFRDTGHNALAAMKTVLSGNYSISLAEAWVDFNSRNLFNGINENFYYYPDQADISPLTTYETPLISHTSFDLNINSISLDLKSFRLYSSTANEAVIEAASQPDDFVGRVVVVGTSDETDDIYTASGFLTSGVIEVNDEIHFLYAHATQTETVSVDVTPYFAPLPPHDLMGIVRNDQITISWLPSPGPGDNLTYDIYRDDVNLGSTLDTLFVDSTIAPNTTYAYFVRAANDVGTSTPSDTLIVVTWPAGEDVQKNSILSVYPNPLNLNHYSNFGLVLDCRMDYTRPRIELINVLGQRILTFPIAPLVQGRQVVYSKTLGVNRIASGVYFIRLWYSGSEYRTQKILILN
ncbi:MAG: hypothetical protein GXO91_00385 [FCB group bacterium]|nr:hypothetical protein [FCB group bacterium]